VAMAVTATQVRVEQRDYLRLVDRERAPRGGPTPTYVAVKGVEDWRQQQEVREGILTTWMRFQRAVTVRDLETGHVAEEKLYDPEDLEILETMDPDELARKRAANELGMGYVGALSITTPVRSFVLREIQVDAWQRKATVTAHAQRAGSYARLDFAMKRSDDGWVFVIDKVRVEEKP
jgi:hypothetical protein